MAAGGMLTDQAIDLLMQISTGSLEQAAAQKYPAMKEHFGGFPQSAVSRGGLSPEEGMPGVSGESISIGEPEIHRGNGRGEVQMQSMALADKTKPSRGMKPRTKLSPQSEKEAKAIMAKDPNGDLGIEVSPSFQSKNSRPGHWVPGANDQIDPTGKTTVDAG